MHKFTLKNGNKVIGTMYDNRRHIALTTVAHQSDELDAFRSSKYIQAYSADAFTEALHSKENYIIVGTLCQIYELKNAAQLMTQETVFFL